MCSLAYFHFSELLTLGIKAIKKPAHFPVGNPGGEHGLGKGVGALLSVGCASLGHLMNMRSFLSLGNRYPYVSKQGVLALLPCLGERRKPAYLLLPACAMHSQPGHPI